MTRLIALLPIALLVTPTMAAAQAMEDMPGMEATPEPAPPQQHDQHQGMTMPMPEQDEGEVFLAPPPRINWGSGTARLPAAEPAHHGLHLAMGKDGTMLMVHGDVTAAATTQGGPRGDDMAFVESMAMLSYGRRDPLSRINFELRGMFSLEPAMGARGYPNLLATGETAGGVPLVDRQHPHDLFMELTGRIDLNLWNDRSVFLYGGPVGEPALGPSAFMHRASARFLPLAPITHHWFDSTHITYGVVTAGYAAPRFQIEASAFRGREPDERRWNIETPKLDSWSVRATWSPSPKWLGEVSYGRLESPEAQHAGEDERRLIASLQYSDAAWAVTAAFSSKKRLPGDARTAWLVEAARLLGRHHSLSARIENVANDELFPDPLHPLHDRAFRVTRFEAGYAWRTPLTRDVSLQIGGTALALAKPAALDPYYGRSPLGWTGFIRLSLGN